MLVGVGLLRLKMSLLLRVAQRPSRADGDAGDAALRVATSRLTHELVDWKICFMKIVQLKYFLALAEELHFGKAAARLHVSQPPLSRQIQALEEELKVALFVRANQRVSLTEAGITFYEDIKNIFASLQRAADKARGVANGEAGRLSIGMTGSVSYGIVPRLLREFNQQAPAVRLEIQHLVKAAQIQGLMDRRLSLGFTRSPVQLSSVISAPIHREPFLVAMHESHRLACCDEVTLTALVEDPFVVYRGSSWQSVADEIINLCIHAGFHPRISQETGEMQTAVSLVATGMGVTLVAESINRLLLPGVVYRPLAPIDGSRPMTTLYAIYRDDDRSPVLAAFLRLAQSLGSPAELEAD